MKQPVLFPNLVARLKDAGLPLENLDQVKGRLVLLEWRLDHQEARRLGVGFFDHPLAVICRIREITTREREGFCQLVVHFQEGGDSSLPDRAYCDVWDKDPAEQPWIDVRYAWEIWPGCQDDSCGWHTGGDTVCAMRHFSEDYISVRMSLLPEKSF